MGTKTYGGTRVSRYEGEVTCVGENRVAVTFTWKDGEARTEWVPRRGEWEVGTKGTAVYTSTPSRALWSFEPARY